MRVAAAWILVGLTAPGCGGGGGGDDVITCSPAGECPAGFECRAADRVCYRSGSAELIDARPPDATPPDATPPDARDDVDAAIPGPPVLDFRFEDDMVSSGTAAGVAFDVGGVVLEFEDARSGRGWRRSDAFNFIFEADTSALFATDRPFTFSVWYLHRVADDLNTNLFGTVTNFACGLGLGIDNLGGTRVLDLCADPIGFPSSECGTVAEPTIGIWHNALARYDGTMLALFVDGNVAASFSSHGPLLTACTGPLAIRADGAITMDDLRFYEGAFAPREQCTIMLGGFWSGTDCTLP